VAHADADRVIDELVAQFNHDAEDASRQRSVA